MNLNAKTLAKLERFIDNESAETVTACVMLLAKLDAAERIFAGEWLLALETERAKL